MLGATITPFAERRRRRSCGKTLPEVEFDDGRLKPCETDAWRPFAAGRRRWPGFGPGEGGWAGMLLLLFETGPWWSPLVLSCGAKLRWALVGLRRATGTHSQEIAENRLALLLGGARGVVGN